MKRLETPRIVLAAIMAAGLLTGCALYQPYEYSDERDQMQGPGLFSDENGVFTVYGKKETTPSENPSGSSESDEEPEDRDDTAGP
jgi:hypothetical protein